MNVSPQSPLMVSDDVTYVGTDYSVSNCSFSVWILPDCRIEEGQTLKVNSTPLLYKSWRSGRTRQLYPTVSGLPQVRHNTCYSGFMRRDVFRDQLVYRYPVINKVTGYIPNWVATIIWDNSHSGSFHLSRFRINRLYIHQPRLVQVGMTATTPMNSEYIRCRHCFWLILCVISGTVR